MLSSSRLLVLKAATCVIVQLLAAVSPASAQVPAAAAASGAPRTRVYLDCPSGGESDLCFSQFLREEIEFVDFVRQPQVADVNVIATGQDTGGGGRQVVLRFVGQGRFAGHDHEFRAVTPVGDTENARREVILRTVTIGLLDYVAQDGVPPGLKVAVTSEPHAEAGLPAGDPWNAWVFSLRASGSFDADSRSRERETNLNANADRVTEHWKISFGARASQSTETFDLEEDEPFAVTRRDRQFNWFGAKSLGAHWSVGVSGRANSSTYNNTRLSVTASPAVEFSVFPYEQYATRQFRLQYEAGLNRVQYYEVTLFGQLEDLLWRHETSATLDQRQPWGSLRAGFSFSQYLHDLSKYRLQSDGQVNLRLARGLSVNVSGQVSRIHDQLSLPQREASDEEVLLRIRQLQSNYQVRLNFGVTYSFGSIFNNVINPRFDG